jgi:hypothetical protein
MLKRLGCASGEVVGPQEYTLIKMRVLELKSDFDGHCYMLLPGQSNVLCWNGWAANCASGEGVGLRSAIHQDARAGAQG